MAADSAYAPARGEPERGASPSGGASRPDTTQASDVRALRRDGAVVFAVLVLATVGGLFLAQRIKHTPTSVQGFEFHPLSFSPTGPVRTSTRVSFRIAHADAVTVTIVGSSGETVATLVRDLPWQRYLRLCLTWNGRRGVGHVEPNAPARAAAGICPAEPAVSLPSGRVAPAGDYRVRVGLRRTGHSVISPSSFALVAASSGRS
jgi:hypothetical protein